MPLAFLFLALAFAADKMAPPENPELAKLRTRITQLEAELDREKREHAYDAAWCGGALQISRELFLKSQQKREK
jgi:hypothetical protein